MQPMAIPELVQVYGGIETGPLSGIKLVVISSVACSMRTCLRSVSSDSLLQDMRGHRISLSSSARTASCVKTVTVLTGSWRKHLLFPQIFPLTSIM